jgi:hypothetical protein
MSTPLTSLSLSVPMLKGRNLATDGAAEVVVLELRSKRQSDQKKRRGDLVQLTRAVATCLVVKH